jgi:hypothetical protein
MGGPVSLATAWLPTWLTGHVVCVLLWEVIPVLLQDVPLHDMWFMGNGAVPFWTSGPTACQHTYPGRLIGHCGPVLWHVWLLDLNPQDFFVWEHLMELVYMDWQSDIVAKLHWQLNDDNWCRHYVRSMPVFYDVLSDVNEYRVDTLNTWRHNYGLSTCNMQYHSGTWMCGVLSYVL